MRSFCAFANVSYESKEKLIIFSTLLGLGNLIGTSLLKIDHRMVAHLIAGTMLPQNPARKFNT
jgi:hypothetical protein